jgi:phosphoglycolate phosphatase-like HAD superfamily hydrolase
MALILMGNWGPISLTKTAAADFGYILTKEDIKRVWGKPFQEMIISLMPTVDYLTWYKHYRIVMGKHQSSLHRGAKDIMTYLKALGCYIAVVSSNSKELVKQDMEAVGVLDFVDSVWGFEDSSYHKPDPRVLVPILESQGEQRVLKEAYFYIGDSIRDYLAAIGNGILFFAVTTGHEDQQAFLQSGLGEEYIFPSLVDLLKPASLFITSVLSCLHQ